MSLPSRVWGADQVGIIHLALTETGTALDLTCDDDLDTDSKEVTVTLDLRKVRELRLALGRYEREMTARAADQDTGHG